MIIFSRVYVILKLHYLESDFEIMVCQYSKLVLFGAGASYGCGNVFPKSPPLGGSLFQELQKLYPMSWGNLPQDLEIKFKKNFEEGMEEIWDKYSTAIPNLMKHMSLYFCQFNLPDDENLYSKFLENLSDDVFEQCIFSSLNYDVLLEIAISKQVKQINYFELNPIGGIPVWKLHGSCNFIPRNISAQNVSFTRGVVFDAGITAVSPNEAIQFSLSSTSLYPSMCLFMEHKPTQISQSTISEIQKNWQSKVSEMEKILIVGVRPLMKDSHIWKSLTETKAEIGFIGSKSEFNKWSKSRKQNDKYLGNYWENAFDEGVDFLH